VCVWQQVEKHREAGLWTWPSQGVECTGTGS
jgi:hypothetical protein